MILTCSTDGCTELVLERTAVRCRECRGTRRRDELEDAGTSPVVGVMLMLLVAMPTVLGIGMFLDSFERNLEVQREATERAAWCAEHPNREWPGEGECPDAGPRGFECEESPDGSYLVCWDPDEDPPTPFPWNASREVRGR